MNPLGKSLKSQGPFLRIGLGSLLIYEFLIRELITAPWELATLNIVDTYNN